MGVKIKNRMETRYIEISLDTAKRWYEQGGELREIALGAYSEQELIGSRLPKTWDEYCAKHGEVGDKIKASLDSAYTTINRYAFSDYKQTQAHIAIIKLHLLRDEYRNGWKPDWKDDSQMKYVIYNPEGEFTIGCYINSRRFLAFQDKKRAKEFLTNFRELIEQAGDLI